MLMWMKKLPCQQVANVTKLILTIPSNLLLKISHDTTRLWKAKALRCPRFSEGMPLTFNIAWSNALSFTKGRSHCIAYWIIQGIVVLMMLQKVTAAAHS